MKLVRPAIATLVALVLAGPVLADDSGNFVVRLGQDTTGVEHYTRTPARLEVDQVGRAPRTLRRHFIYDYKDGAVTHVSMVVAPPGSATPTQTLDLSCDADSLRMQIHTGSAPVQSINVARLPGVVPIAGSSPWSQYEAQFMKLARGKQDSLRVSVYYLGASTPNQLVVQKLGRDSVTFFNDRSVPDVFHARIDKDGRIVGVLPISGTQKFSVDRVASLDVAVVAAGYLAREQAGAGMGMLSPRDTVRADAGGATLWVDYGRPGKRGRVVYGGVVPYGEVWRTGANAATQFKTDKALDFGGTVVPAGFYTLWSIPTATGWKLVINSETGQWGTEHKADKDLYTIPMQIGALSQTVERFTISVTPSSAGGTLNLDWDTTRASVAFVVKP